MTDLIDKGWKPTTLGETIILYDHKRIPLNSRERAERQGPFPYYGASGIIDYIDDYIFDGRYLLIAEDGENLNSRKTPVAFFASGRFWVNNHAHIVRANPKVADDYFLKCVIQDTDISGYITGAAQPKLSQANLKRIRILLPPLGKQKEISRILSAYDDLIENNTRRIEILEEMAQNLYREWFVHFRFPGHENVKMVDSGTDLGDVPEGWDVMSVSEAVQINPKVKVPKEGEKPYVPMGCLVENSMLIENIESRTGNSGTKFQNGDTLFARITPSLENGKTGFVRFLPSDTAVAFGSTEFIVLRSKDLCPEYVYLLSRTHKFRQNAIKSMVGASGRQRVQVECFDKFLIAHPDQQTINRFIEHVRPMFQLVQNLSDRNETLRETRDLLLPRLISGEVDVSDLNISLNGDI